MDFASETKLNISLANLISKHHSKNAIILLTRCRKKRAVEILKHHKLLEFFSQLICWEDLQQGESANKYESAIKLTRAAQKALLVFEDDNNCIEEAATAGIPRKNIHKISLNRPEQHGTIHN